MSQLARHPARPYTIDYLGVICDEFQELAGDRAFADDAAIVGGLARIDGRSVVVIGHQKGRDTKSKIRRNFGMPRPEGYRKALRLMKLAERFKLPLLTFIDTPGAYPGIGAEERGQSEAIARNLLEMAELKIPVICTVIGEGGSGGALAIGVGDRTLMLEYSTYSVISPEGCASILWKTADKAKDAAEQLGLTAKRLLEHGPDRQDRARADRRRAPQPAADGDAAQGGAAQRTRRARDAAGGRTAAAPLPAPARLRRVRGRLSAIRARHALLTTRAGTAPARSISAPSPAPRAAGNTGRATTRAPAAPRRPRPRRRSPRPAAGSVIRPTAPVAMPASRRMRAAKGTW